jgi:lysophospholipase L1-like esterase
LATRRKPNESSDYLVVGAVFAAVLGLAFLALRKPDAPADSSNSPRSITDGDSLPIEGQRVLLIGSSSAMLIKDKLESRLRALGVSDFKGVGIKSTTLRQWSDNVTDAGKVLEQELANFKPTLVIIIVGTNDEGARQPQYNGPNYDVAGRTAPSVARLRRKLSGVRSLFIGMPKPDLWPMDRKFRDLLQETWGSDFLKTEDMPLTKAPDKLHLSSKSYADLADAICAWIKSKG